MAPEWMTIEAASDVLGGGLKGVLTRAARNGQLPSQQFGRHRYIHERGLSDYIEGCRIDHVQAPTSPRPSPASLIDNATSGAQP
jgi:hypothetical protein